MVIIIFVVAHWYTSLFFQSVFHHRYAAHGLFTMSKFLEKIFYWGCFITQGSSYISANTYGIMHRLHHAHTDTEEDPHSPSNTANVFTMMWQTRNNYFDIYKGKTLVEDKYRKDLPEWKWFEKYTHNFYARFLWIAAYITFYYFFATEWWMWLFLPLTIVMGSLQGASVNWWAHRFGYVNFKMKNTSKNIMPVDFIFWGEAYHNNHHQFPGRANNATRWFEFDMGYGAMRLMDKLKMIKMKPAGLLPVPAVVPVANV
ncbi:MAG: acyl-CoA desaturase [Chitinophagales bacterium]|nr:acyl-CoA desaturase [Chitinophagales bacterium]